MHKILATTILLIACPYLDAEEPLPSFVSSTARAPRETLLLRSSGGPVSQLAFSADGTTLAARCTSPTAKFEICVWNTTTGKLVSSLKCDLPDRQLTISGNHKLAAIWPMNVNTNAMHPEPVVLWDLATGAQCAVLKHPTYVDDAKFLHDNQTLMTSCSTAYGPSEIKLWDLKTGAERPLNPTCRHRTSELKVSPDGSVLASREESGIRFWNDASGIQCLFLTTPNKWLEFSPDSKAILCEGPGDVAELREVTSGKIVVRLPSTIRGGFSSHSFSQDGKLLAWSHPDGVSLTVWDVTNGKVVRTQDWHNLSRVKDGRAIKGIYTVFANDEKTAVTTSVGGEARIWDIRTGASLDLAPIPGITGIDGFVAGIQGLLTIRPTWPNISCPVGEHKKLNEIELGLWNLKHQEEKAHWHRMDLRMMAISRKYGLLAFSTESGAIKLWNLPRMLEKPNNK